MWFGYVPQIKNTNVISARGLHFSRFPATLHVFFLLVANVSPFPTTNLSAVLFTIPTDISASRVLVESGVSTLESQTYICTRAR